MKERLNSKFELDLKPTQVLVLGFLFLIVIGTVLLSLPAASISGESVGFVNALFTATSAVCVTGLVVVNTLAHWTVFGKTVILFLIQIGGLGFMTITTTLFILLGRKIRLKERLIIQEALNQYTLSGMVRLTINILIGTVLLEGVGAAILSAKFIPEYGFGPGLYMGVFHAISAFCNAGFDIVGGSSLVPFAGDVLVNLTVMGLIVLGGLGFSVWLDLIRVTSEKLEKRFTWQMWFTKLSLHSKFVLVLTVALLSIGFLFFLIVEGMNPETLGAVGWKSKILGAMFQSVTPRTAGFNTLPLDKMTHASMFMTIILMFIGGSPAGTAGGIKTVTMGVIFLEVLSVVRAKEDTELFGRRIPASTVKRALAVIMISLTTVIFVTMILSLTETGSFLELFFETVSAFGTVGLTLGLTGNLTTIGKLVIAVTMFIGRLGPITMAVAFSLKSSHSKNKVKLPEERLMVG